MLRRLASISLLLAWMCASGGMLDVAQGVAWARMFAGYAGTESICAAARDTFDPARPCPRCKAVRAARETDSRHAPGIPAPAAEKMILVFQDAGLRIVPPPGRDWPEVRPSRPLTRGDDVPQPPPKALAG